MICVECEFESDWFRDAIEHEEQTGHRLEADREDTYWDEVDYEYARHKENW